MRSTLYSTPFLLSFLFTLILLSTEEDAPSECESDPEPVSLELVHRHDPRIPWNKNVKLDKHEVIRNRVLMDLHRRGLSMVQMPIRSVLDDSMYGYYVQLSVGMPPQKFWMIADTGSELAWIRCNDKDTTQSDTQSSATYGDVSKGFSRKMSKTYKQLTCGDPKCKSDDMIDLGANECHHQNENCTYTYM